MGRRKPMYTNEFKKQAVELVRTSGRSVAQVAQELGINKAALYKWQQKPERPTTEGRRGQAISLEEENRQLRRENQRLKMEHEFLKKAAAFFAKQNG